MALTLSSQATESGATTDRSETSSGSWTDRTRAAYEDRAREAAKRRSEKLRARFGQTAFDVLEEYFPEEAKSRRRRHGLKVFLVGMAVGILLRHLADR